MKQALLIAGLLVAAPAVAQNPYRGLPVLTDADADGTRDVQAGRAVVIALPAAGGSGRTWSVMKITNARANPVRTAPSTAGTSALGAPETSYIRVQFSQPGDASVVMGLFPPGAGGAPEQVLHYHFNVTPIETRRVEPLRPLGQPPRR